MNILLIQLPIPKMNFGLRTGNIPLGAACLKQAVSGMKDVSVEILPQELAEYAGDGAVISAVVERNPDMVGFTVFSWNFDRSVYIASKIKERIAAKIVFGGPQITSDTIDALPNTIDFAVIGEGEAVFQDLVKSSKSGTGTRIFQGQGGLQTLNGGPYLSGYMKPSEDGVMLVETQRGCPYRCGFCFYGKSRKKIDVVPDELVLDNIAWGIDNGAKEIYLMDPSLNTRPGLKDLLKKIAAINASHKVSLISEIRAESVTGQMAQLYKNAGFIEFEVGLQSTNPAALETMNRRTDLGRFLEGVRALQQVGIKPVIDLIFGLPGDTLAGFNETVRFVKDHGLDDHVQVFPLLVLPGTPFRMRSRELGIDFNPHPPYPVISTNTFSPKDLEACLDFAEEQFDRTFYPFPDLDVSYRSESAMDRHLLLDGKPYLSKLLIERRREPDELRALSKKVCAPFQVFFKGTSMDDNYARSVLEIITKENPFIPIEVVWIEPGRVPDVNAVLDGLSVFRPHFLDLDQHYLFPEPGNRSVLFTVISRQPRLFFEGTMKRQVFLWDRPDLPENADLLSLSHLDGVLLDSKADAKSIISWQDKNSCDYEDFTTVSFRDTALQVRWLSITEGEKYNISLLSYPS